MERAQLQLRLAEEIKDLWMSVAKSDGIDCVILAVKMSRDSIQYTLESSWKICTQKFTKIFTKKLSKIYTKKFKESVFKAY